MWKDPIVAEIRQYREAYAARFNYDLDAICRDLQEKEKTSGRKLVSRPPRPHARSPSRQLRNWRDDLQWRTNGRLAV